MSLLEVGKEAKATGSFNILKDTTVNTDFISFTPNTFQATVDGLSNLFTVALTKYNIPSSKIFTVVSSGVKMQAEKEEKTKWINNLVDSFKLKINEPKRQVGSSGRYAGSKIISSRYRSFLQKILHVSYRYRQRKYKRRLFSC